MNDGTYAFATLLVGVLSSLVISLLKNAAWRKEYKALLSLAFSVLAGGILAWTKGDFSFGNVSGTIGAVFTVATTFYLTTFEYSKLEDSLTEIEVL